MFVFYCFKRRRHRCPGSLGRTQTNEVVLDNLSAGVTFSALGLTSQATRFIMVPRQRVSPGLSLGYGDSDGDLHADDSGAGFYPVYGWAPHGANRTNQLYRILHTGGESQVRVPHHMVGNGWVYLGTYYFTPGRIRQLAPRSSAIYSRARLPGA